MYRYGIVNGMLVDGSGKAPYKANLYVDGDRIAKITAEELPAQRIIDASGLAVSPGFIDVHSHADVAPWCTPGYYSYLQQGVTSMISGNCGGSLVPNNEKNHDSAARGRSQAKYGDIFGGDDYRATDVGSWAEEINGLGASNNGMLVGHGALRNICMADPKATDPTPEEMAAMKEVLRTNLDQGAFGLSLGLEYVPGAYSRTEELIELAKVVAEYDRLVTVHMRGESRTVGTSLEEMARVARESGVRVEISHFKITSWPGHVKEILDQVDGYLKEGLRMTFDQYPYTASSTGLSILEPKPIRRLTHAQQIELLKSKNRPAEQQAALEAGFTKLPPENILIAYTRGLPECDGKTVKQIMDMWGLDQVETICRLLVETDLNCQTVYFSMVSAECEEIAKRMDVSVVSDGSPFDFLTMPVKGTPHPRNFGTFVRFLRLARERNLMPLEKAVYKMTGLPSSVFHIRERGQLKEGWFADIAVFDPETVSDSGDFVHPAGKAVGVKAVFVNGELACEDGNPTGSRTGRGLLYDRS